MRLVPPRRLALAAALIALGCARTPPPDHPNLLLVTFDTLRADRLGCYGHDEGTSPALDALAREGVRFAQAYATAPITAPSHASLLTGRYPLSHGVRTNGLYHLDARQTTLAELLQARGYRTAAFVGAVPLDRRFGFAQGFDLYDQDFSRSVLRGQDTTPWYRIPLDERERRADEVVAPALEWLGKHAASGPFFLWVHLFDPHSPYAPPDPWQQRFYRGEDPRASSDRSLDAMRRVPREWNRWTTGITDAAYLRALYDGEVGFADAQLGRLLAELARLGRAADTVVAATADHGEAFGEHDEWFFHGDLVHEPTIRVPLLLRAPWRLRGGEVAQVRARGVDLLPTLLELLGADPAPSIDGTSLLAAVDARAEEPRPVLVEAAWRDHSGRARFAYLEGHHKVVWNDPAEGQPAFRACFDLQRDPRELDSRCQQPGTPYAAMFGRLETLRRSLETPEARASEVDPEVLKALESLGYVSR